MRHTILMWLTYLRQVDDYFLVKGITGDGRPWTGVKEHEVVAAGNVYCFITCTDCRKPRVVYVAEQGKKLDKHQLGGIIRRIEEAGVYVCGDEFPSEIWEGPKVVWKGPPVEVPTRGLDCDLGWKTVVAMRAAMDCMSPMERFFYDKNVGPADAEMTCFFCGDKTGTVTRVPGFARTYPLCASCAEPSNGLPGWKHAVWRKEAVTR
jgi:hypothetical protein